MRSTRRSPRWAFTLTELLVVLALVAFLLAVLLPTANAARARDRRVQCATNLRQIGQAIMMYSHENKGNFPRVRFAADQDVPKLAAYTNWKAKDPFKDDGPAPNDVTASFYMVMRTQDIASTTFVCPEGKARPIPFRRAGPAEAARKAGFKDEPLANNEQDISNFPGPQYLGYSYQCAYPTRKAREAGFKLNFTLSHEFAIASDINPGGAGLADVTFDSDQEAMKKANSPNHGGEGQNVLFADGHVEFQSTPFCGMPRPDDNNRRDNIFTPPGWRHQEGGDPLLGPPTDPQDSVLLPTADYAPEGANGADGAGGAAGKGGKRSR